MDQITYSLCGRWAISADTVQVALKDHGTFVVDILNSLAPSKRDYVISSVGQFIAKLVDSMCEIKTERESNNDASDYEVPPVLPYQLVKTRSRNFNRIVSKFSDLLKKFRPEQKILELESEHRQLLVAYSLSKSV